MKKRRDSKILLAGVEYDLSNLLTKEDICIDDQEANSESSSSEDSGGGGGYLNRRAPNSRPSLSRTTDNNPFEHQAKTKRRQSPYRFDLQAMRTLMTSFRGVPELSNSFRLSKTGRVVEAEEPTCSSGSGREDEHLNLLGHPDDEEDEEEEDLLPPLHHKDNNSNAEEEEVPARISVSSTDTTKTTLTLPLQTDDHDNDNEEDALDDLVYDHATGTYVYKPQTEMADSSHYHDALLDQSEYHDVDAQDRRFTLEEMVDSAAIDGGEFDDDEHEMEISPGHYVPFRGAKETWQAVATHCIVELQCFDCAAILVCINDCEFTVCPDCRVVNPVFSDDPVGKPFGVGMGFKKEWVLKKQMLQAERERRQSDRKSLVNQGQQKMSRRRMSRVGLLKKDGR